MKIIVRGRSSSFNDKENGDVKANDGATENGDDERHRAKGRKKDDGARSDHSSTRNGGLPMNRTASYQSMPQSSLL